MRGVGKSRATAAIAAALLVTAGCMRSAQGDREERAKVRVADRATVTVVLVGPLSTEENLEGDLFRAAVADPVAGDGGPGIPAGAGVSGLIADLAQPGPDTRARLTLKLVHFELPGGERLDAPSEPLTLIAEPDSGGAPASGRPGDVLGTVLGTGGGAEMGSALGPDAGTVVVLPTRDRHLRLAAGQKLQFALEEPPLESRLRLRGNHREVGLPTTDATR